MDHCKNQCPCSELHSLFLQRLGVHEELSQSCAGQRIPTECWAPSEMNSEAHALLPLFTRGETQRLTIRQSSTGTGYLSRRPTAHPLSQRPQSKHSQVGTPQPHRLARSTPHLKSLLYQAGGTDEGGVQPGPPPIQITGQVSPEGPEYRQVSAFCGDASASSSSAPGHLWNRPRQEPAPPSLSRAVSLSQSFGLD